MNDLIQLLVQCLKDEAAHYRKLTVLADGQKDLLMAGKTDQLPENVRLEEKEVFALNPLIGKRNDLLAQMAKGYRIKTLSLAEAIKRAPVELVEELKSAVIELVQSAKRLEETNQTNEKLLKNALSYVNFTLKIIANGGKKKAFSPSVTLEEKTPSIINRIV